jgi:hypothetical protein
MEVGEGRKKRKRSHIGKICALVKDDAFRHMAHRGATVKHKIKYGHHTQRVTRGVLRPKIKVSQHLKMRAFEEVEK